MAQFTHQFTGIGGSQVCHGHQPECQQFRLRHRPDPGDGSHWLWRDELRLLAGNDDPDAIGFGRLRSQFGQELAAAHPDRCGQPGCAPSQLRSQLCDVFVEFPKVPVAGFKVNVCLIQAEWLHQG